MMPNFWQLATTPILKIDLFPLGMLIFSKKNFLNLYPSLGNSTTDIAIVYMYGK